ncbi:MAG: hypothetical protein HYZ14_16445 [Bacteroidetes bacterium]|nr:hypothetical protein [Bacteroidota bacterium]
MLRKIFVLSGLLVLCATALSQRHADLGIRLNSADYNRVQLEFRKPVGENYYSRFGLSIGFQYNYPRRDIFDANDTVVTTRQEDIFGNHYDFRFGFEREISYEWLTFHADLIFAYSSITNRRWNYYHILDSTGTSWDFSHESPYGTTDETATAVNSVVGGGVALGLSFNFPVTENFILNFTGNYTGMMRYTVAQKETNDLFNEFEYTKSSLFEVYPSAGLGLRFIFTGKESEAPVEP